MEPHVESSDLLLFEENFVRASTGKRFANYIIDVLGFYAVMVVIGACIGLIAPSALENVDDSPGFGLVDRIVSLFLYALYMGVVEGLFKGKSLGKLITKTRAVHLDGSKIGWSKAFARGFSRAVPFCVFSAFGTPCDPWQDRWTSTMVIDEKNLINA
jgi:uncharacterized RDD family membrane protein YckC